MEREKWPEGSGEASQGKISITTDQEGGDSWHRVRKLEMPIFNGEDPDGWLFSAKRYFEVNGLTKQEKMGAIGVSLEGDALSWLQWTEARRAFQDWQEFRKQLLLCFRPTQEGSLCEKFLAVRQEG